VVVSVGIGRTELHIVEPNVKVKGEYYRETLLKGGFLQDMHDMRGVLVYEFVLCESKRRYFKHTL